MSFLDRMSLVKRFLAVIIASIILLMLVGAASINVNFPKSYTKVAFRS